MRYLDRKPESSVLFVVACDVDPDVPVHLVIANAPVRRIPLSYQAVCITSSETPVSIVEVLFDMSSTKFLRNEQIYISLNIVEHLFSCLAIEPAELSHHILLSPVFVR